MPSEKLLPCPFCGGEAVDGFIEAYSTDSSYSYIGCRPCDVQMPYQNDRDRPQVVTSWNRRTPDPHLYDPEDDYIDRLNTLCEDFGCEPGSDRLLWLHDKLSRLSALEGLLREAGEVVRPFAAADRAIGDEPGPFRFETARGHRTIERADLRRARSLAAKIKETLDA